MLLGKSLRSIALMQSPARDPHIFLRPVDNTRKNHAWDGKSGQWVQDQSALLGIASNDTRGV